MVRRPLPDAKDDELGRPQHGDTDHHDKATVVEIVLCDSGTVASNKKRLFRFTSGERAFPVLD